MLKRLSLLLVLLLLLVAGPAGAEVPQVVLLQNSGWMEPFFVDPLSQLKPLAEALAGVAGASGEEICIASFNQAGAIAGESSPRLVYRGKAGQGEIARAVRSIGLPRRADGKYADADFEGGLNGTLEGILGRRPAVVWMITNNKNDPNNSPDVTSHTQGFYRLLREHPGIVRVAAIPVTMPAKGVHFREGGLMIYALSFGQSAGPALERVLASDRFRALFPKPAIRLKPLEEQPVTFTPTSVRNPGVTAVVKGGTLVLSGVEKLKGGGTLTVKGVLDSKYYPQEINEASLSVDWGSLGKGVAPTLPNAIRPASLRDLPPGGKIENVEIDIQVPSLPPVWSADSVLGNGYQIGGSLRITLNGLRMSLAPAFLRQMENVFGLDQLPEIFYPDRRVTAARTLLPVLLVVRYPVWPLALGLAALLLAVFGGFALLVVLNRDRRFALLVDGDPVTVSVRPLRTRDILSRSGDKVGQLRAGLSGPPTIKRLVDEVDIRLR